MPTLDSTHTWLFTIDGVDVTDYVDPASVAMTDAEGAEVDTLYLELVDVDGALDIAAWQEISWTIDPGTADELIWFGGFVIDPQYSTMDGDQGRVWRLKCEGYGTLLARLPAGLHSWVDSYPGDIVVDLLDQAGLTSQDSEVRLLSYLGNDTTTAAFGDAGQTWADWDTTSGDAGYALVVTNTDGTISWGYLGALSGSDITVYQDLALTSRGWNGVLPVAGSKAPDSYHVRRAELFSGHRPIGTTNVSTGDNALLSFGTTTDETIAQVFVRLAKQLGFAWRVDAEAGLHFGEPALSDPAPFNVSDGENATYVSNEYYPARAGTFAISRDNGMDIRNRILIHGGAKSSGETTELFYASASGRVYQLSNRNLIDITVLVNGSVVADGTVWWNTFDDRVVLVNYAEGWIWFVEDFLILGDTIEVIYRYWEGLEYELRDEASIEQYRQVFTCEITDRSITSRERAAEVAQGILDEYSGNRYTGSFEVWRLGLRAGQDIKLKFPSAGLDAGYVIRKMDCRIDPSNTGLIVYCEFGSRQTQLSELIPGSGAATPDQVWLGQLGPYTAYSRASIAKPVGDATVALAKQHTAIVDASSNDIDIALPPALTRMGDSVLVIRVDESANAVTLIPTGGETINESASLAVANSGYDAVLCYSDGASWFGLEFGLGSGELSSYLLTSGARAGASSQAQTFTNGIIGPSWKPASDGATALQLQNAAGTAVVTVDTTDKRVGIGTTPGAFLDLDSSAQSIGALRIKAKLNENIYQYLKPDGNNLARAMWDGGNFLSYVDAGQYWNIGSHSIYVNGTGSFGLTGGASFILNDDVASPGYLLDVGGYSYATASTQLTTLYPLTVRTFAWNGSNGYDISSLTTLRQIQLSAANNSARFDVYAGGSERLSILLANGNVGIGDIDPANRLSVAGNLGVTLVDAATAAATTLLRLSHNTSDTPASGFGSSILFELESSTAENRSAAALEAAWNTATDATRQADLVLSAYDTVKREGIRIRGNGSTSAIGFFGATPVARPGLYSVSNATTDRTYDASATTIDELADVLGTLITDLISLGLLGTGGE